MTGSTTNIITAISQKKLPLSSEDLEVVKKFCEEQKKAGNFTVLGDIAPILYHDWISDEPDPIKKACQHINVNPVIWRQYMENYCAQTVEEYLKGKESEDILTFLMWRGALAYAFPLADNNITQCHTQAKRDEFSLKISFPMPLAKNDSERIKNHQGEIIIPDPMLASGSSFSTALEILQNLGVQNNQITILSVVAAPEGIFRLLNNFPGIKIITAALHACLNKHAYIIGTGLGDAGDKYMYQNSIEHFESIRHVFSYEQWCYLMTLLQQANP